MSQFPPLPRPDLLTWLLLAYLAGAASPYYYAVERLRGFGRLAISRLPYKPPPGMEEGEAMREARKDAGE